MLYDFKRGLKAAEFSPALTKCLAKTPSLGERHRIVLLSLVPKDHKIEDQPQVGRASGLDGECLRQLSKDDLQRK